VDDKTLNTWHEAPPDWSPTDEELRKWSLLQLVEKPESEHKEIIVAGVGTVMRSWCEVVSDE